MQAYSLEKTNEKIIDLIKKIPNIKHAKILDLGAGEGFFTKELYNYFVSINADTKNIYASDFSPNNFKFDKISCDFGDFNQVLQYSDNIFDVIVSIEVIEHVEDQFKMLREIYRILKPGGTLILTTPNILTINSKIKFFATGLYSLFDLLPLNNDKASCFGHINPVSFPLLSWYLLSNRYEKLELHSDRNKKSAIFFYILFYPIFCILSTYFLYSFKSKHEEIFKQNNFIIKNITSFTLATSRTLIISAKK